MGITTIWELTSVCVYAHGTKAYLLFTPSDVNHSISTMRQHLGLLGHKKEHNAPQLNKAQCNFCCYSETHPSLSPTHISKIINRCPNSLFWPEYHKHTSSFCVLFVFQFCVIKSGYIPLHFLDCTLIALILIQSGFKKKKHLREHVLNYKYGLIPFQLNPD